MKIISDVISSGRICRLLEIETDDINLKTSLPVVLSVYKWSQWGDYDETDWEWASQTSEKIYNEMTEEKQEEVIDIINEYTIKL